MSKKVIIVINGKGGCGKDTFVEYCSKALKKFKLKTYNFSSIDKIKEWALIMGWDGVKDAKGRKFLSDLKSLSVELNDGPLLDLTNKINKVKSGLIFVHIREISELRKFKRKFPGVKTLLLVRHEIGVIGNKSDDGVNDYKYSYIINNDGSLEELSEKAQSLVKKLFK